MLVHDLVRTAFRGVTTNVSRSLLTMLGIIIGVGSVVLMSSIGQSMQGVILSQISSLGANSMVIFPGNQEGGPAAAVGQDSLTFEDVEALKKLSTIQTVAPVVFVQGLVTYGNERAAFQTFGVDQNFFLNQKIEAEVGRLIDLSDEEGAKPVAVLGSEAQEKLFGNQDPIGKRIKVGDRHYTVVGVAKALGSQFFQSADDRVYVPLSVAKQVAGQKYANYITMSSVKDSELALADVNSLLRQRHDIDNPNEEQDKDDFIVRTSQQASDILGAVSLGLTLFITTIAGISLLVGGIGIMNIMLVSVTERTREIGLRKAVGARSGDILRQFLLESVLLTVIGGCIGAVIGIGISWLAALAVQSLLSTYAFAVSMPALIAAFIMAALTGMIFGIAPARRASKLSPMEALRYE